MEQPLNTALTDGSSSISFGTVTVGAPGTALTFTIKNPGTTALVLGAITVDGTDAASFVAAPPASTVVQAGGSTTFTVTFTPGTIGAKTAGLHLASNVTGTKNPFDIALNGTGQQTAFTTAFNTWATTNGVSNDPDALGANGIKNLLNYAFGVHPVTGGPGVLQYTGTFAGSGTITATGQPITMFESVTNGIDFRAVFVRRKDYIAAGLIYTPQFSATLGVWANSSATPTVLADDGTYQIVSVPYPFAVAGKKARFFQISVSTAP